MESRPAPLEPLLSCCPGLECCSAALVATGGVCWQMLFTAASRKCIIKRSAKRRHDKRIKRALQTSLRQPTPAPKATWATSLGHGGGLCCWSSVPVSPGIREP